MAWRCRVAKAPADHLVVGPAGVTVLETRAWAGKVWSGRSVIGQGRRVQSKPVDGVRDQVRDVQVVLTAAGRKDVDVSGVVCFVDDNDGLPRRTLVDVDGVPIGRSTPAVRHAMRDGPHDVHDVTELLAVLQTAFAVRGGAADAQARRLPGPVADVAATATDEADRPAERRAPAAEPGRPQRRARVAEGVGLLVLLGVLAAGLQTFHGPSTLSRNRLDARAPALRAMASQLAGREVMVPRVLSRSDEFVLTYRGGPGCLVRFRVQRTWGDAALEHPASRVRGCLA